MKLKFQLINGYGVLVDEESDPFLLPIGKTVLHIEDNYKGFIKIEKDTILGFILSGKRIYWEVIFAEKELGLDVPVFEWRDFEVEKLAEKSSELQEVSYTIPHAETYKHGFIDGYKSNPARFTEDDLRKAIELALIDAEKSVLWSVNYHIHLFNKIIESLKKYPQYVVMDSELNLNGKNALERATFIPKVFINSEGKQQGTVKELIWS